MSKSLGNFFTVKDVAAKYDPQTIRFYFLNTHYMSPLLYGEDMLEEAKAANGRIVNNYKDLRSYVKTAPEGDADSQDCCDVIESYRQAFRDAMDDDFNTRQAIEVIFQMVRATNKAMNEKTLCKKSAQKHIELLDEFNGILNIIPKDDGADDGTMDGVMSILIDLRAELRKNKMYDLADMIRDRLKDTGIVLEDSKDGAKWKKI